MKKNILSFLLGAAIVLSGAFLTVGVVYAMSLTKSLLADFNAGTYSDTAHQTLFGRTGVQINVSSGPNGTQFKLPITIDNTASINPRTNYVVVVPIDTANRVSGGLMQSDCGDIRFRDADDSTAITEFEIRSCNTASSYILIEVPSIPAASTKQVFMYFGSPTVLASQSSPQVVAPGEVFEDMETAPSGDLKGTPPATYNSTDKYVQLTTATNNVHGELEYTFNPGDNFDATFDLWAGGGSGADAVYLYVYSTSTPDNEYADSGGYILQVNDLADYVAIQYQGEVLVQKYLSDDESGILDGAVVDDSAWHPIRMTKTGDRFRVYFDNVKLIDYVDDEVRDLSGTLTGVGARTGALNNIHRIKNLRISQTVVSSDAESLNAGTWQSPSGSSAYNLTGIEAWGDGDDSNSTAFSAAIASVSAQATIEFQVKTAETVGDLTTAEYVSIGTASAGTTYEKTKQELDDAGVLPQQYLQLKAVLSRTLSHSPVLQNFSFTYDGVEPTPSPTAAPAPQNESVSSSGTSAPSTPTCSDKRPVGVSDLFQINRSGNTATLYFTPTNDHVNQYHVIFGFLPGDERFGQIGAAVTSDSNTGVQSITINSLDPNVPYWFKVIPVNGCAVGDWSNWLQAKRVSNSNKNQSIFYRWF